jgi:MFS family permease
MTDHAGARASAPSAAPVSPRLAVRFIVLLGAVSLLADVTYEGARAITGPYLALLGASATIVGFVSGAGELVGYALRLVSGYLSDRTGRVWAITFLGYAVNLLAVPMLALAGSWEMAAALMLAERAGSAIRKPARDAMLSHATSRVGHGFGFGLHEAMDQVGAVLGPLIVSAILYANGGYRAGFAALAVPALLALAVLVTARALYPRPRDLDVATVSLAAKGFTRAFWLYLSAVSLIAAGYADFPLIAFHFETRAVIAQDWIPVLYALAMATDAVAALFLGRLFDRIGLRAMIVAAAFSMWTAPFAFLGGEAGAVFAMIVWGIGMGAQESIMRAAVAAMTPIERRGTAYGLFNAGYGLAWFAGSAFLGVLYDMSLPALVAFSVVMQGLSLPLLWWVGLRTSRIHREM